MSNETSMGPTEINLFWDEYQMDGIEEALAYLKSYHGSLKALEGDVPGLVNIAREREIDLVQFLKELDEFFSKEDDDDTNGTDNDGGELRPGSDSAAVCPVDENTPSPSCDDDRGTDGETDN